MPTWLDIEPTNQCNFKCPHCQLTYWEKEKKDLTKSSFLYILNQFSHLNFVKLQGIGEPFLNKNLTDMLLHLECNHINSVIFTNGSILPLKFLKSVNSLKRLYLNFSIDGPNAAILKKIRPDSNFSLIEKNISKIVEVRGYNDFYKGETSIWAVISKQNVHELISMVDLAYNLKIDKIYFQFYLFSWANLKVQEYNICNQVDPNSAELKLVIKKTKDHAREIGMEVGFHWENYYSIKNKCRWPFRSAFICSNGDVVPCCVLSDSSTIKMGNVFEEDFGKIWNSKKYKDFRESIKKHKLYEFCKSCYGDMHAYLMN